MQLLDWLPKSDSASESFLGEFFFYVSCDRELFSVACSTETIPLQPILFVAFGPGRCCQGRQGSQKVTIREGEEERESRIVRLGVFSREQ